jgi:hypothetical protein
MLKAIAAGAALICASVAWFIIGIAVTTSDPTVFSPGTIGTITGIMSICGVGLLVLSPFIGLFNWAARK